jgi:hypothetical protein
MLLLLLKIFLVVVVLGFFAYHRTATKDTVEFFAADDVCQQRRLRYYFHEIEIYE